MQAKNIVILNGSPRREGNTSALIAAFTAGAEQAGHQVKTFFLHQLHIQGCQGCFRGRSTDACPCVLQDDMNGIYAAVRDAQIVVLASPLYYWNLSGELLTALDRLFALEEGGQNLLRGHERGAVLLMAAEGSEFQIPKAYFELMLKRLKWQNLGMVCAGGVMDIGDIAGRPELDGAKALGRCL